MITNPFWIVPNSRPWGIWSMSHSHQRDAAETTVKAVNSIYDPFLIGVEDWRVSWNRIGHCLIDKVLQFVVNVRDYRAELPCLNFLEEQFSFEYCKRPSLAVVDNFDDLERGEQLPLIKCPLNQKVSGRSGIVTHTHPPFFSELQICTILTIGPILCTMQQARFQSPELTCESYFLSCPRKRSGFAKPRPDRPIRTPKPPLSPTRFLGVKKDCVYPFLGSLLAWSAKTLCWKKAGVPSCNRHDHARSSHARKLLCVERGKSSPACRASLFCVIGIGSPSREEVA